MLSKKTKIYRFLPNEDQEDNNEKTEAEDRAHSKEAVQKTFKDMQ